MFARSTQDPSDDDKWYFSVSMEGEGFSFFLGYSPFTIFAPFLEVVCYYFPMTTHDFAATALFGSMLRRPRHPSGDGADVAAGAGGTATTAAASASDGQADASLVRVLGAFPDCVLSKLNSDGPAFASVMKRLIADYCGVFYEAAFTGWVAEVGEELEW